MFLCSHRHIKLQPVSIVGILAQEIFKGGITVEPYIIAAFIIILILVSIQYSINKIIILLREIKEILYLLRHKD